MKLIKISNSANDGFFTNAFSNVIDFEADSQVALVNSVFGIALNNIVVDATNNTLKFTRVVGNNPNNPTEPYFDVVLILGNYTQLSFIQMLRTQINSIQTVLYGGNTPFGFDINPVINDGYFSLSYEKTPYQLVNTTNSVVNNMNPDAPFNNTWISAMAGTAYNYKSWIFAPDIFQRGSGYAYASINDRGFFGLFTRKNPKNPSILRIQIQTESHRQ